MSNDFLGANFHYLVKLFRKKLGNPFFFSKNSSILPNPEIWGQIFFFFFGFISMKMKMKA